MKQVQNKIHPPVCLTIAGLDPSGGAGIIADIRTFSSFGCFAAAVVASVTFQNTTGVFGAVHQSARSVRLQAEPVIADYTVAAVKTGMLPTRAIIREVARLIRNNDLKNVIVDPVVRSTSGFDLIDNEALTTLISELFPLADLITPNLPEAERIAGLTIATADDIMKAANFMHRAGARNVLIKGGHLIKARAARNTAKDYLFVGDALTIYESDYIETTATHGTGCVLSAAIAANLAVGRDLKEAVGIAKDFVTEAIRSAPNLGKGHSPINI